MNINENQTGSVRSPESWKDRWLALMIAAAAFILLSAYMGAKQLAPTNTGAGQALEYNLNLIEQDASTVPPTISVREGDRVTLRVLSAEPGELMIHGMNRSAKLIPGREASLRFSADRSGRYFLHIHDSNDSHKEVAVIEVAPR